MGLKGLKRKWILLLVSPNLLFLALFFGAPLVLILSTSLYVEHELSLANYVSLLIQPYLYGPLYRTIEVSALVTLITLVLGYPVAYYISKSKRLQGLLLVLVIFPLMVGLVIQSFGWITILGRTGIVNTALISLGLIHESLPLLYNMNGILIGLVQMQLPFMVLALLASLTKIDPTLIQAAENLGAGRLRILFTVILPLSIPGVLAGSSVVFSTTVGVYVVPALLGGGTSVLSTMMANNILQLLDWPTGSSIALIILVVGLLSLAFFARLEGRIKYYGAIK